MLLPVHSRLFLSFSYVYKGDDKIIAEVVSLRCAEAASLLRCAASVDSIPDKMRPGSFSVSPNKWSTFAQGMRSKNVLILPARNPCAMMNTTNVMKILSKRSKNPMRRFGTFDFASASTDASMGGVAATGGFKQGGDFGKAETADISTARIPERAVLVVNRVSRVGQDPRLKAATAG